MRILKISKHVSNISHVCLFCQTYLKPISFEKFSQHHFPWGILYVCSCGKSKILTNFIRSETEFVSVVFTNHWDIYWSGFCNDYKYEK
jgi:hypothetical protein